MTTHMYFALSCRDAIFLQVMNMIYNFGPPLYHNESRPKQPPNTLSKLLPGKSKAMAFRMDGDSCDNSLEFCLGFFFCYQTLLIQCLWWKQCQLSATAAESHRSCSSLVSDQIPAIAVAFFHMVPYSELTSKGSITIRSV